ncbi:hypothetical protein HMPREF2626_01575 [Aerococcus sp. HMSC062A02]|uniref:hypothetical protein n=1 Tax=Aerococcus sp. HMSC062A02 TaxID=1715105 RepID=UPI0008A3C4BE|nr:hypothetical protein [Aerococcus sp. HMSC062A02]OFN02627.1 hypothetical protein HMPREF2626_01575 [Aerococcus sp. HMSC062A02]
MAYIGQPKTYDNTPNFLKSAHFQAFTNTVTQEMAKDKKTVKAGTIFPANDATAKGIVYKDVDVSNGAQEASIIVEGYILEERLPEKPSAEAKAQLAEIKFY